MHPDPLSDVLAAFDTRATVSGGIIAGERWAIRFPPPGAIKFGAVVRGGCWHEVDGIGEAARLTRGDVFVVNGRHALCLASDPDIPPVAAEDAFANATGNIAVLGQGEDFHLLGGHVALDPLGSALLADILPPTIHISAASRQADTLVWLLDRLVEEMASARPGCSAIAQPLAHLLFLYTLRDHIETSGAAKGWLRAAGDPRIGPAMSLMHADPARNWGLAELAEAVGMSRSSFAERFKAVSGMAPLAYLTFWRMRLAESSLRKGARSLAALSSSLGYASESAFSTAFKRVVGMSPAQYRNEARTISQA